MGYKIRDSVVSIRSDEGMVQIGLMSGTVDSSSVTYNPEDSSLVSKNVEDALNELSGKIEEIGSVNPGISDEMLTELSSIRNDIKSINERITSVESSITDSISDIGTGEVWG